MILSILICTIEGRENFYNNLINELNRQIDFFKLKNDVEILTFKDKKGENTIGAKRNHLLDKCKAKYECFIDDDDMICDDFLNLVVDKLKKENPDVLRLDGIITTDGKNPKTFIHSIEYKTWFEKDNIYYRPPNHLNPIKCELSKQFKFKEINMGEDKEWSMDICNSNILKKESTINKIYYFYNYISNKK